MFYREYQKSIKDYSRSELVIEAAQLESMKLKKRLTSWEYKIKRKLENANIEFETKFRIFPVTGSDRKDYIFIPDFTIRNHAKDGKTILVEANEDISTADFPMFSAFMQMYGGLYHLIMIVTDNQLRLWNNANENLFHEIWTIEDISYFINDLKKCKGMLTKKTSHNTKILHASVQTPPTTKTYTCVGCKSAFNPTESSQIYCQDCLKLL